MTALYCTQSRNIYGITKEDPKDLTALKSGDSITDILSHWYDGSFQRAQLISARMSLFNFHLLPTVGGFRMKPAPFLRQIDPPSYVQNTSYRLTCFAGKYILSRRDTLIEEFEMIFASSNLEGIMLDAVEDACCVIPKAIPVDLQLEVIDIDCSPIRNIKHRECARVFYESLDEMRKAFRMVGST